MISKHAVSTIFARAHVKRAIKTTVFGLALTMLAACGSAPPKVQPDQPVETLYNTGMNLLGQDDRARAITFFEEVERQHPYSVWANKSILMAAYTRYTQRKFDDAVIGLDRFIRLHPGSRDVPYAYYLRALCFYEQIADIQRDQAATRKALETFGDVVRRYPQSQYAKDAKLKLDLTYDQLAGQEMTIGRWYERRGEYQAAINRFKLVVDKYQTTSHTPEALHRLTESYLSIGLTEEARKTAAVLGHNFPGSEWYVDSYQMLTGKNVTTSFDEPKRPGWFSRSWNTLF
ncbi:MAG: outer membrane protein assembly factor BamD [Alphaproteobacteria bacterium]|jgi:outer membrane protein assembly factor BamD